MVRFDVYILGAGIAGLAFAEAALKRGLKTGIADPLSVGSGASGAPVVITNIATGRRAKRAQKADVCLRALEKSLHFAKGDETHPPFFKHTEILRPAFTADIASDFRASLEKYAWQSGELEWMEKSIFSEQFPWLGVHEGGLRVRDGFTIDAPRFLRALLQACERKGLQTKFHQPVQNIVHWNSRLSEHRWDIPQADGKAWVQGGKTSGGASTKARNFRHLLTSRHQGGESSERVIRVEFADGTAIETANLIYAAGAGLRLYSMWDFLPMSYLKGELLELRLRREVPAAYAFSGLGYVASDPADASRVVVGSTFERQFDSVGPTEKGQHRLMATFGKLLPDFSSDVRSASGWAGVRVSSPDYQPVTAEHPEWSGHWVCTGLGSKGMLMSAYLASEVVDRIAEGMT